MPFQDNPDRKLKYARIEAERKFLLNNLPPDFDLNQHYIRIVDHYLTGTRLRLRRMESPAGGTLIYKLGQKYKTVFQEPYQTIMTNFYLNESEYRILGQLNGAELIKRRYSYENETHLYSLDIFEGNLTGLILAEIEQQEDLDITLISVPAFAVREVTGDVQFNGARLASMTRETFLKWFSEWKR